MILCASLCALRLCGKCALAQEKGCRTVQSKCDCPGAGPRSNSGGFVCDARADTQVCPYLGLRLLRSAPTQVCAYLSGVSNHLKRNANGWPRMGGSWRVLVQGLQVALEIGTGRGHDPVLEHWEEFRGAVIPFQFRELQTQRQAGLFTGAFGAAEVAEAIAGGGQVCVQPANRIPLAIFARSVPG